MENFDPSKQIDPSLQALYYWEFSQSEDNSSVIVTFHYPPDFNFHSTQIDFSRENGTLEIKVPSFVPFVQGKLFNNLISYEIKENPEQLSFQVIFEKEDKTISWPRLINGFMPGTHDIDPHSGFELYIQGTTDDNSEEENNANDHNKDFTYEELKEFFTTSLIKNYVPAILFLIESLGNENNDLKEAMLELASMKYHNPEATFAYALFLIGNNRKHEGFNLLKVAAEQGIGMAISIMGQMISPLSGIEFDYKDAESALDLFEKVIAKGEEPVALYEAAKLYQAGVGCNKDVEKAKLYWQRAKKVEPRILDLPEDKPSKVPLVVTLCTFTAATVALGYGIYKIFKKPGK